MKRKLVTLINLVFINHDLDKTSLLHRIPTCWANRGTESCSSAVLSLGMVNSEISYKIYLSSEISFFLRGNTLKQKISCSTGVSDGYRYCGSQQPPLLPVRNCWTTGPRQTRHLHRAAITAIIYSEYWNIDWLVSSANITEENK